MDERVTYHQQISFCGRSECKRCRRGTGHGPYWYAYQTIDGHTKRSYVGKNLPPEVVQLREQERQALLRNEAHADQARLRFYTLGQLRVERHDGERWQTVKNPAFQHEHVRALLVALLSSPKHTLTRDQLTQTLWPGQEIAAASHNLDHAVHRLRQVLDPTQTRTANTPLLLTERTTVFLAEYPLIWIDADAFENHFLRTNPDRNPVDGELHLEKALALYGGRFLPDEQVSKWLYDRRKQLRRWYNELLLEAVNGRIQREQLSAAASLLKRLLASEPDQEFAAVTLMQLLVQMDQPAEAMKVFEVLQDYLHRQFVLPPLPETLVLYEEIRARYSSSHEAGTLHEHPSEEHPSLPQNVDEGQCVGRKSELQACLELVREIERSSLLRPKNQPTSSVPIVGLVPPSQTLVLVGDVGTGKTHLTEEMKRIAATRNWDVLSTRSHPSDTCLVYSLWTPVIRSLFSKQAEARDEIVTHSQVYGPLAALVPELEMVIPTQEPSSAALVTEREHLAVCDALCSLLVFASKHRPQFLAVEDLHNADSRSCELFARLVRKIQGHSIALVTTVRERDCGVPLRTLRAALQRERVAQEHRLENLSDEQIRLIVTLNYHSLDEQDIARVVSQAGGNPLFAEALAHHLQSDGEGTLPEMIVAVCDHITRSLSNPCRQMLSRAAVLEASFSFPLAQRLLPDQDEEQTLELIEEALHVRLLIEEGNGKSVQYHFGHPLYVPYFAANISAARRDWLVRRVADLV